MPPYRTAVTGECTPPSRPSRPSATKPRPLNASTRSGVHGAGLPATSSRRCSEAVWVAGDSLAATDRSRASSGDSSRTSPVGTVGSAVPYRVSMATRPCFTRPRTAPPAKITAPSTRAPTSAVSPTPSRTVLPPMSHLHLDEPAHPERAENHQHARDGEHHDPDGFGVQRSHVLGPGEEQPPAHRDRQGDQDVRREAALGGQ